MGMFETGVDGRITADPEALRVIVSWMARKYRDDVTLNGAGNRLVMDFMSVCAESVRIREVLGPDTVVPHTEPATDGTGKIEVSAEDAAARMSCTASYVRRLARQGRLRARRAGRDWLIDVTHL